MSARTELMKQRRGFRAELAGGLALVLALAGCGKGGGGGLGAVPSGAAAKPGISGTIFGGTPQNPISGSALTFYAADPTVAGATYGTNATTLATGTSDSNGNFILNTYTCPASNPETYITAIGGTPATPGSSNTAVGLMATLGPCNSLTSSTFVFINELTTVAGEWALAQFSDSTGTIINAPNSTAAKTGLTNAFNLSLTNLVDFSSGNPAAFWPAGCPSGSGGAVNCGALRRMDTLGNILSACVNSSGPSSTACSTLFTDTGLPSTATTLQAAHVIALAPASNVASLFGIQGSLAVSAFLPDLTSAPTDFTLALNYTAGGLNSPHSVAIDTSGDAWVTNLSGNSVTELTPLGAGAVGSPFAPGGSNFKQPAGIAIDASGNVWAANFGGNTVTELNSSGGLVGNFAPTGSNFTEPLYIAIDTSGNAWVTNFAGNSVTELTSSGGLKGNFAPTGSNFNSPFGLYIDSPGNVWVTNFATSGTGANSVTELNSSGGLVGNFHPAGSNFNGPAGIAIDALGNVWAANLFGNSVTELTSAGALVGNFAPAGNNFNNPRILAIDTSHNVWVVNQGGNSVTELNSSGNLVGNFTGGGLSTPFFPAIDASGNVWVTNNGGSSVTEFVGAAGPVTPPLKPGGPARP